MDNDIFTGREVELGRLKELYEKKSASLVTVRGRRRIGKSRLVEEFARRGPKNTRLFTFTGLPPTEKTSAQTQRDHFAWQLGEHFSLKGLSADNWSALFSLLATQTHKGRIVILLDEISWMGSEDEHFLGKLKDAWDLEFKKNPQLILVICGSVSTWIQINILSNTAFFGRISLSLRLEELPLQACHKLLLNKGFHRSPFEELKILAITGGIPWYLEHVQSKKSADDTIRDLCFREGGVLFDEFDRIFTDLFKKRSPVYKPIVEALAERSLEFNALCKKLGYAKSGTLSEYLEDLIESGFVSRDYTWSLRSHSPSKISRYRLSDNFLRFYLKYVLPYKDRIIQGRFHHKSLSSLPEWGALAGLQFENLVLKNRNLIWEELGIKPEDVIFDNPYFQRKKGCQIDYLIQTRFNALFLCEIKFSLSPIKGSIIPQMQKKIEALALPKKFSCWPVLIHVSGVSESIAESNFFAKTIDFTSFLDSEK